MAEGQIVQQDNGGPLCPRNLDGNDPLHRLRVQALDALHEQLPKDSDGEMSTEGDGLYGAVGRSLEDHMRLYVISSAARGYAGRTVIVEAWYFRCPTCGFILPATSAERLP